MGKVLVFGSDARSRMKEGVNEVAAAVMATLGPSGRTVEYEGNHGFPLIIRDGVTVAKMIEFSDPIKDMAAQKIKKAALASEGSAGDGTTTTTAILNEIINKGFNFVESKYNVNEIKKGMITASNMLIESLEAGAKKVTSKEQIRNIANISTNYDEKAVEVVLEAWNYSGANGAIKTEESRTGDSYTENVKGMQINQGYLDRLFANKVSNDTCEFEKCFVLATTHKINSISQLSTILEYVHEKKNQPLLIICDDIDNNAVKMLLENKFKSGLNVCVIKSPGFGSQRDKNLDDISHITGCNVLYENKMDFSDILTWDEEDLENNLGYAEKIIIDQANTLVLKGGGDKKKLDKHLLKLEKSLPKIQDGYEKEKVKDRIARLHEGVSIVYAGGKNDIEINELRLRIEDALHAIKSSVEKGYIQGGGLPMLLISREYLELHKNNKLETLKNESRSFITGFEILMESVQFPFKKILENAGEDWTVIQNNVTFKKGYDAKNREYVDFYKAGIIDPVKVTITAIENAVSIASLILTTEVIIHSEVKQYPEQPLQY